MYSVGRGCGLGMFAAGDKTATLLGFYSRTCVLTSEVSINTPT